MATTQKSRAGRTSADAAPGIAASAAMFIVCMDTLITNVGLPTITAELGGGMAAQQWIVDGYTLPFATLLLLAGNLSDRFGAKRVFAAGTALFAAASLLCGVAPNVAVLIAGRAALGIGAALILPSSMALIKEGYEDGPARSRALAFWGVGGSAAAAVGPILGGILVPIHWSLIFLVNVPICVGILALVPRLARSPRNAQPFDLVGQVLAIIGLGCLVGGVIEGGSEGFAGFPAAMLAVGAIALAAFLYSQTRAAHPMMPLDLFDSTGMRMAVLGGFVMILNWNGLIFMGTLALQQQLGLTPFASGMAFVPAAVTGVVGNLVSDRLVGGKGFRFSILVAVGIMMGGFAILAVGSQHPSLALIAVGVAVVGSGGAVGTPSLAALVLRSVDSARAGIASAVFNTMRQVGGAMGIAAFGVMATTLPTFADGLTASYATSLALLTAMLAYALHAKSLGRRK